MLGLRPTAGSGISAFLAVGRARVGGVGAATILPLGIVTTASTVLAAGSYLALAARGALAGPPGPAGPSLPWKP